MRGPPRSTRTDPLFPYPPLFRSLPRRGALPLLIPSATGPMGPQSPAGDCGLLFGAWGAPAASFAGRGLRGALAFALAVLALARPRRLAALQPALDHPAVDQIGRAHARTPLTNAHLVCRLPLGKQKEFG